MPPLDRRLIAITAASAALLLFIGFGIGRLTAGGSDSVAADATDAVTTHNGQSAPPGGGVGDRESDGSASTGKGSVSDSAAAPAGTVDGDASAVLPPTLETQTGALPVYGTDVEQGWFLIGVADAGVTGTTQEDLLATANHVCYTLERLQAQERSPSYATRVVWNESLAHVDSQDLAAFAAVFQAAPMYLCPDSIEYATEVAYWLGY